MHAPMLRYPLGPTASRRFDRWRSGFAGFLWMRENLGRNTEHVTTLYAACTAHKSRRTASLHPVGVDRGGGA